MADRTVELDVLAAWMRANGATRAKAGDLELELSPQLPASPLREPVKPSEAEKEASRAKALHEAKRRRLRMELGYTPTDEFMAQLP